MIIIIIGNGCSYKDKKSQYYKNAKQFNKVYFETVDSLEMLDTMKTLEQLHTEKNLKNIENLNELLGIMEKNLPKGKEKIFGSFRRRYEELVFLRDSYLKYDKLSKDEHREIFLIFIGISSNIEKWKDKTSNRVWE